MWICFICILLFGWPWRFHARTHTHTVNPSSVNTASSGLSSLGADCQHHCVRGESYLILTSVLHPSPGKEQLCLCLICTRGCMCYFCICARQYMQLSLTYWCLKATHTTSSSLISTSSLPRMEWALRCDDTMLQNTLSSPQRDELLTKWRGSWWGSCSCTLVGAMNKVKKMTCSFTSWDLMQLMSCLLSSPHDIIYKKSLNQECF